MTTANQARHANPAVRFPFDEFRGLTSLSCAPPTPSGRVGALIRYRAMEHDSKAPEHSTTRKRRRRTVMLLGLMLLSAYAGGYLRLRATHRLTHFSNAEHWHPEKREAGHHIGNGAVRTSQTVQTMYKPLMLAEETLRNLADRLTGCPSKCAS